MTIIELVITALVFPALALSVIGMWREDYTFAALFIGWATFMLLLVRS